MSGNSIPRIPDYQSAGAPLGLPARLRRSNELQTQTSLEETKQRLITANGRIAELARMYEEARAKLQRAKLSSAQLPGTR